MCLFALRTHRQTLFCANYPYLRLPSYAVQVRFVPLPPPESARRPHVVAVEDYASLGIVNVINWLDGKNHLAVTESYICEAYSSVAFHGPFEVNWAVRLNPFPRSCV